MRRNRPSALDQRLELSYWMRNGPKAARKAARIFSDVDLVTPRAPKRSRPESSGPNRTAEGRGEGQRD